MISPDAGNLGVKAVFVWAGLLLPTTILLWLFYPEVSDVGFLLGQQLTNSNQTYARTYWELDELYARNIPAWRFKNTPTLIDETGGKSHALMSKGVNNTLTH